jgi:hypothetical protein
MLVIKYEIKYYYYLTAVGLTPGGSSIYLRTNSTQNTVGGTHITITSKKKYKEKKITITRKQLGSKLGIAGRAVIEEFKLGLMQTKV